MIQTKYAVVIVTYNRKNLLRECISRIENQTVPVHKIIIVNNASTDGTKEYLEELAVKGNLYQVIECPENIGGAGGFAKGIAEAVKNTVDCVLIIDDDAMLAADYMEKLLEAKKRNPKYGAFAGCVKVDGKIDTYHRKMLSKAGLFLKRCDESLYRSRYFECEIASFCGMLVDRDIIEKIGLPHAEYFILHDDTEYSLRIHKWSNFLVVSDAVLNHKTKIYEVKTRPRRYDWRDYYEIRNRILYVKEHGNTIDKLLNWSDLFIRVIFRNWIFGFIRKSGYDWKYEKDTVRKAIRDVHKIEREV